MTVLWQLRKLGQLTVIKNCFIHDNIKNIPLKNNTHEDHLCIYKDRNLYSKLILLLFLMSKSMYTILLFLIYNILLFLMSIFILKHIHNNTLLLLLMSINIYFLKVYFAHGILQARILEWVAIPFSRGSSWPRSWTHVSCIAGRFFTIWASREAPPNNTNILISVKFIPLTFT